MDTKRQKKNTSGDLEPMKEGTTTSSEPRLRVFQINDKVKFYETTKEGTHQIRQGKIVAISESGNVWIEVLKFKMVKKTSKAYRENVQVKIGDIWHE